MKATYVAAQAGITYRQLDHWLTTGYIHADDQHPGSGQCRDITPTEADVITVMGRLVAAGIPPATAAPLARQLATGGTATLGNIHLTIKENV